MKKLNGDVILKGLYRVDAEKVKTDKGHLNTVKFGQFTFKVEIENLEENTVTIGLTALDSKALDVSEKIVINVVGRTMNTNQIWNEDKTTTKDNWGVALVLVVCLKVSVTFLNGENPTLYVLDKDRKETGRLNINFDQSSQLCCFESDDSIPSIWYVLTRE